jgi:hypothetical protein
MSREKQRAVASTAQYLSICLSNFVDKRVGYFWFSQHVKHARVPGAELVFGCERLFGPLGQLGSCIGMHYSVVPGEMFLLGFSMTTESAGEIWLKFTLPLCYI